jgi:SAM-dependent methyltransferase
VPIDHEDPGPQGHEAPRAAAPFVDAYLRVRDREARLLPDESVLMLPRLPSNDPRAREWRGRGDTASRFDRYLRSIREPVSAFDLGCGNGWFTARMAAHAHVTATGYDINDIELDQARRVFAGRPRLEFRLGDLRDGVVDLGRAVLAPSIDRRQIVVLASALQYVADVPGLVSALLDRAQPGMEIHVLDTPIYDTGDVEAARERTRRHYEAVGVPEMVAHYHHHDWRAFDGFRAEVLHDPMSIRHRVEVRVLRRRLAPFPWVRITRQDRR